jgi:hypothetical protein
MKKIIRLFTKLNEEAEVQIFIEEVHEEEELRTKTYKKPAYTNPCSLRLGSKFGEKVFIVSQINSDYCPV